MIVFTAVMIPLTSETENEIESSNDLYVFLITGQSNSAYRLANVDLVNEEVEKIPYGSAYYIGTYDRPPPSNPTGWEDKIANWKFHPMNDVDGDWRIGSYEPKLASMFYEATGKRCLIIDAGWDSASINACQPGEYLNEYVHAMFERGMSLIPDKYNVKLGCMFWAQGEADDDMTVDEYKTKFLTMWNDYQDTMGWKSILMAQTRLDQSPITPTAQEELDGTDNIYLATKITQTFSLENGLLGDVQHYSQAGRLLVAEDWMNYYLDNIYSGTHKIENASSLADLIRIVPLLILVAILAAVAYSMFRNRD